MDFKTGKQIFLKAKQSQMVTAATYKYYNTWLRDFFLYAMDMGAYSVEQVRPNILEGYLIHLKTNRKVRNITINDSYRAIRAFFKFMVKNRYIDYCVTDDVQTPRIEKKMTKLDKKGGAFTRSPLLVKQRLCHSYLPLKVYYYLVVDYAFCHFLHDMNSIITG